MATSSGSIYTSYMFVQYGKFKDMSIQEFEPSGENIMCSCKTMIDIQQSKNSYSAEVTEPLGDLPSISGLK